MKDNNLLMSTPPLNGPAVKMLEDALINSPTKAVEIEINNTLYRLSQEGQWFKFSRLTKKRTIKRATLFETITQAYNQVIHGQAWRIANCPT